MIAPTTGRALWYQPSEADRQTMTLRFGNQPCAANITHVHNDRLVDLTVSDHNGVAQHRTAVPLVQEGDTLPAGGGYSEWMPFQVIATGRVRMGEQLTAVAAMARLTPLEARLAKTLARMADGFFAFGPKPTIEEVAAVMNSNPGTAEILRASVGGTAHGGVAYHVTAPARDAPAVETPNVGLAAQPDMSPNADLRPPAK